MNDLIEKKSDITEIHEIVHSSSIKITGPLKIANQFNKHFTTVGLNFASDRQVSFVKPDNYLSHNKSTFQLERISPKDLLNLISNVNTMKATGLDCISNKIIKISANIIYEDLAKLFNKSIESNIFPVEWKTARVVPIFKSGDKAHLNNYRPILVISAIGRLFERQIYNQLYLYLKRYRLLNSKSGFRSLHSTVTALLDLTNNWCFNIDRGMVSGVIFWI